MSTSTTLGGSDEISTTPSNPSGGPGIFQNTKVIYTIVGALLAIGIAAALISNQKAAKAEQGRNALYSANRAYEKQLETLKPATPVAPAPTGKDKKAESDPFNSPDAPRFEKLDVDAKLGDTVAKFKSVAKDFDGTRPAFEARLALGDLYMNHGEAAKSVSWYEEAAKAAPGGFEKMLSYYSLGQASESSGKSKEALEAYDKALNMGEGFKGDILLGMARAHEALNDSAKAKSTYEQILSQLPNTEYARLAEFFIGKL